MTRLGAVLCVAACACTGDITGVSQHSDAEGVSIVLAGDELANELRDSPVHRADAPFRRVGAIWEADRPEAVEISVSADGVSWSSWSPIVVQHIEIEGGLGTFVGQLELDGAQLSHYRLRAGAGTVAYLRLEFLPTTLSDSIEDGDDSNVTYSMQVGDVDVHSRSEWGARSTRCTAGLGNPYRMAIHHTETPTNDTISPEARLRSIQSYHMDVLGWCDIGYHYLMSRDGRLWEGRPDHLLGAHTGGNNTGNVGISVIGSHMTTPITSTQVENLADLIRAIADERGIPINRSAIKGHREYKSTDCPGDALYAQLDEVVDLAASGGGDTPPPTPPPPTDLTVTVMGVLYVGSDTSDRIEGATVTLGGESVITNSVGLWVFEDVPEGSFTVTASAAGYETGSITRTTYAAETWASFGLSPAGATTGTAVLQGVIYHTSDSSNRIGGASITLSTGESTTADENGFYLLTDLPAGPVTITASASGWETGSVSRTLVDGQTEWGSVRLYADSTGGGDVGGEGSVCERCSSYDFLCCNVPENNMYYLTAFSGETMACGGIADGVSYYATTWVRWYCGAKLRITNPENGECVVVEVRDAGPAAWVEESAGGPVIDASPQVCRDLFGSSSCGWSDHFVIEAVQVADSTPTGPSGC